MPSIPELVYAALLYKDGESPTNPESKEFVQGAKATDSDKLLFSFQRPDVTSGKFTLEICAFVKTEGEADAETPQFSRGNALLSGNEAGLEIAGDKIVVDKAIPLSSKKPGTVNLKIKVPTGCSLEINDTTSDGEARFSVTQDEDIYTLTQAGDGISAGAYQVTFTVKKGGEIVYIFSEYINVINGLCTDTWNGLAKDEVKKITQSMISSTVYVCGTGEGWYKSNAPSVTASDENSGSLLSPLATIQKAVDKIIVINDGTSAYTVYVDGTLTQSTATNTNGMTDFSALDKNLTLTIKALSGTATLNANQKSRVIFAKPASDTLKLTLENVDITGGETTSNGGGVYVGENSEVTISGDTTISSCTATNCGGGVYVDSGGTFRMSGTAKITGCKTTSTDTSTSYGGGGICNSGGTLTVTGGTISDCTAEGNGGGIYLSSSSVTPAPQCTIEGVRISECTANYGGGVYVGSGIKFRMSGTTITGCEASESGGGVVNLSDNAEIRDCVIKSCKASSAGYGGGGIYNYNEALIVIGGEISENYAKSAGGGIYNLLGSASKSCSCTLTSVKIFKNKTDNYGGGVYNRTIVSLKYPLLILNGGTTVSENNAMYGGGVYDFGGLTLNDATVSQNTATKSGGDVYAREAGSGVNFSGTTFAGDIYLDGSTIPRHITVYPDLACVDGKTVCATITLPDGKYVAGIKILQAADGVTIDEDICNKFALSEESWEIVPSADGTTGVLE